MVITQPGAALLRLLPKALEVGVRSIIPDWAVESHVTLVSHNSDRACSKLRVGVRIDYNLASAPSPSPGLARWSASVPVGRKAASLALAGALALIVTRTPNR